MREFRSDTLVELDPAASIPGLLAERLAAGPGRGARRAPVVGRHLDAGDRRARSPPR